MPLPSAQNIQLADRTLRLRYRPLQNANQPIRYRLNTRTLKQVRPIAQPQMQPPLVRPRRKAQGIMRRIYPAETGQPQPTRTSGKTVAVDRIVLEHHQRVEQLAQSRQALDLGQA